LDTMFSAKKIGETIDVLSHLALVGNIVNFLDVHFSTHRGRKICEINIALLL